MSYFDEIISPEDQLMVYDGLLEIMAKLWIARQTVILLKLLLEARIDGPHMVDRGTST